MAIPLNEVISIHQGVLDLQNSQKTLIQQVFLIPEILIRKLIVCNAQYKAIPIQLTAFVSLDFLSLVII